MLRGFWTKLRLLSCFDIIDLRWDLILIIIELIYIVVAQHPRLKGIYFWVHSSLFVDIELSFSVIIWWVGQFLGK